MLVQVKQVNPTGPIGLNFSIDMANTRISGENKTFPGLIFYSVSRWRSFKFRVNVTKQLAEWCYLLNPKYKENSTYIHLITDVIAFTAEKNLI